MYEAIIETRYPLVVLFCPCCGDFTENEACHALVYRCGEPQPLGALCDWCVERPDYVRDRLVGIGDLPSSDEMTAARERERVERPQAERIYREFTALLDR